LVEPEWWPSKVIRQRASLGSFSMQDGFLIRNEAQEKHLSFVPKSDCRSGQYGVKG
jgi:hypothetical protein